MANEKLNIELKLNDKTAAGINSAQKNLQGWGEKIKKNWKGIVVAVYGATRTLSKAFEIAELGAKAQQIEDSFARMAQSVGIDANKMQSAIMKASDEIVNFSNVASNASILMAQGLGIKEVESLMTQARATAKLMGKDIEDVFSQLTGAIAGGYTVSLKRSLALNVDVSKAIEEYANKTGMSKKNVEEFYKAQAIANSILQAGQSHVKAVDLTTKDYAETLKELQSRWLDFKETGGKLIGIIFTLTDKTTNMKNSFESLKEVIYLLGSSAMGSFIIVKSVIDGVSFISEALGSISAKDLIGIDDAIIKLKKNFDSSKKSLVEFQKKIDELRKDSGIIELPEIKVKEPKKQIEEFYGFMNNFSRRIMAMSKDAQAILVNGFSQAIGGIQNLFSDVLYNTITGSFKNIGEAMRSFGRYMLQIVSQIIARMLTLYILQKLVGLARGAASPLGQLASAAFPSMSFGVGTESVPRTGLAMVHRGEKITPAHENNQSQGGGGGAVIIIQAWDAADVYRNRSILQNIVAEGMSQNSVVRRSVRGYA